MFDIGWSELLVIAVVAILVVGPKDLPKLMRGIGHYAGKLRRAASDFQRQFEEAMREAEIEEVKKAIESVRTETPAIDLKAPIDRPIMLPKPGAAPETSAVGEIKPGPGAYKPAAGEAKPPAAPETVAPGPAKPASKPPRKRAAAKAKSPAKRAKPGAERGP